VPVRFGLLSTARINDKVLAGLRLVDGVEALAVASRDGERARAYADARGIERAHGSYEALLADPDVDAVYISLPNALHVEWTLHALAAGKHVLCEKPLSARPEEVERVFDAARAADRHVMEAFMYRHHPQTARAVDLVRSGAIGELRLVRATFGFALGEDPTNVRLQGDLAGGGLMDVGCYCVSAARLVAGEPERVHAELVRGGVAGGVDVRCAGVMRHPGDVLSHFDCGLDHVFSDSLELVGSEASLFLDDPWHCRRPLIELRRDRDDPVERIEIPPDNPYALEVANLAAAIRGEGAPLLGRDDAVGQARTLGALYASAERGAPVAL
jgi:predicted dehydrogenase